MPTYEFKCPECGKTEELITSVYTNHSKFCDLCKIQMDKQFSSPGVIFKGEGWAGKTK
jgi:putative FmdB family regulatory protein